MKQLLKVLVIVAVVFVVATVGGSFYMLSYSLSPDPAGRDTTQRYQRLAERYPEAMPWMDSLKAVGGLRDTFVTMPTGERHHGYYVRRDSSQRVAIVLHGWRNSAIDIMHIGRVYHQLLGCHVLMPDLHAHGLSEGDAIGMGWNERLDVLHWMEVAARLFGAGDFVVHGVSMGAATTMNVSGEAMPPCVRTVRFVEDCGYTSVWDEFHYEMGVEFGLPAFPLMYTSSLLCRLRNGWSFGQAAPLEQVRRCQAPMLFIHGDDDHFVPSWMVHPLYEAKPGVKQLWITRGTAHAKSYSDYTNEYIGRLQAWMKTP